MNVPGTEMAKPAVVPAWKEDAMRLTLTKPRPYAPLGVVVLLVTGVSVAEAGRCHTFRTFYNDQRRVPGPVNVECGTGRDWMHTAPFGNWGVDSPRDNPEDGRQFAGWKNIGNLLQWNSCTSKPKYRTSEYLPDGEPQLPDPDSWNIYAQDVRRGPRNVPCRTVHRSRLFVATNLYMKIYELDLRGDFFLGGNGSDLVNTLRYPIALVPLVCDTINSCRGRSPWLRPLQSSNVSANIQLVVHTDYR